mmetsp:Transcript_116648/g.201520  ORF Transcript_116648/g.201520 Transcript_116648/m.201520 type:complete len:387 (+) Transcript_116648:62-1222(+)
MLQHVLHFSHSHDVMISRIYVVTGVCTTLAFVLGSTVADVAREEKASTLDEFPNSMPALATMKYISILAYWIHHKWAGSWTFVSILSFRTSKCLLVVSGFVLQFAEERRQWRSSANQGSQPSNPWSAFFNFVQRRITKLYPLYALSVVVGYLVHNSYVGCKPVKALLVVPYWIPPYHIGQCWGGAWFIPAIMACYVVFPFFSSYLRKKTLIATCILLCFCSMLAQLTYIPSVEKSFHRQSFAVALPWFLLGMVLARFWVFATTYRFYHVFCAVACSLSPIALYAAKYTGKHHEHLVSDVNLHAWTTFWLCALVMGLAGPAPSQASLVLAALCPSSLSCMPWHGCFGSFVPACSRHQHQHQHQHLHLQRPRLWCARRLRLPCDASVL